MGITDEFINIVLWCGFGSSVLLVITTILIEYIKRKQR